MLEESDGVRSSIGGRACFGPATLSNFRPCHVEAFLKLDRTAPDAETSGRMPSRMPRLSGDIRDQQHGPVAAARGSASRSLPDFHGEVHRARLRGKHTEKRAQCKLRVPLRPRCAMMILVVWSGCEVDAYPGTLREMMLLLDSRSTSIGLWSRVQVRSSASSQSPSAEPGTGLGAMKARWYAASHWKVGEVLALKELLNFDDGKGASALLRGNAGS